MVVVEVGHMGVQPGKTPLDPRTADGKILHDAWRAVTTAPGGPERVFWALEEDDASRIWAWFDWESVEQHEEFAKSFGGEATKRFGEVFTPGFTKHAYLDTSILRAPVTEVMLAFFPGDINAAQQSAISERFQAFREKALEQCTNVTGVSAGWGRENDFPVRGRSGEKGSVFFGLIGWPSVEAHMAFRETSVFKENVGLITGMEDCVALDMFHLKCAVLDRGEAEQ